MRENLQMPRASGNRVVEELRPIRAARPEEAHQLADIWHQGWMDAHAHLLPQALRKFRTLTSFRRRVDELIPIIRVAETQEAAVGFHIVREDELYQLYVSASHRGAGPAKLLIKDAETMLRKNGIRRAWLACAIGNDRAARFYEKHGWHCAGVIVQETSIEGGTFPIEVWRFERRIPDGQSGSPD